jgi:hypothetical protein
LISLLGLGPQSYALLDAELDFRGSQILGEVGTGDFGIVYRSTFEIDLPQIATTQIGVAEVGIAEDEFAEIHAAKIDAAQIGAAEINRSSTFDGPMKSLELTRSKVPKRFVIKKPRLVHGRFPRLPDFGPF